MAEIQPLRGWRFNHQLSKNLSQHISPLFDVVSKRQREMLYDNPLNSIHLSVPKGEDPATRAAQTLAEWKTTGIIQQDLLPAIYIYYQYFNLPGSTEVYCRKGFICNIKAYDWHENVVLRHENTMPAAVKDRVELLKSTQLNASATHGLYSDPNFTLETIMDESMKAPLMEAEDYQGVREVVSVIQDTDAIGQFVEILKGQQIILADGHHRYQGSIDYRKICKEQNPEHSGKEGYNYHMMFFTNMEAHDLRILATHRLIRDMPNIDTDVFLETLGKYFEIFEIANPTDISEIILGKSHTFGLILPNQAFKLSLKADLAISMDWPFPPIIKDLDLTVLHYYIIEKALSIPGTTQRSSENIVFDRNFADCVAKVQSGVAQMALITNELSMEQVKKVCFSGYTLPQKSTYFYPKVVCGFVFGTLKEDEFNNPHYPSF